MPAMSLSKANPPAAEGHRFALFDGLRAIAVLAVVYSHWVPEKYHFGFAFGRFGVQLFFVLSGFLITGLLLKAASRIDPEDSGQRWHIVRNFMARRVLRIFPVYYLTLAVCFSIDLRDVTDEFAWHALYLSNVLFSLNGKWGGASSHFWSLSVEEQFYLAWPLVIVIAGTRVASKLNLALIAVCALVLLLVSLVWPESLWFISILPVPGFIALAGGAVLAFQRANGVTPPVLARPLVSSIIAGLLLFGVFGYYLRVPTVLVAISHLAMILACVLIVAVAAQGGYGMTGRFLRWRPVAYLGTISYGFYLFHNFAPTIVNRLIRYSVLPEGSDIGLIALVLNFGITLALAALSWVILERPINRLKARFPYVSASPAVAEHADRRLSGSESNRT
jgi:peptidoglycan/LPS O-acetylase OafA/YrhL